MLLRLGVKSKDAEADAGLAQAAFRAFAEGRAPLRWEPFFFDWFCGNAERALGSVRGDVYRGDGFAAFREAIAGFEPDRPERLADPYFAAAEPEELLYDQIEALWADIADRDDWAAFEAKLAGIERARTAWGLASQQDLALPFGEGQAAKRPG
jgi:hypothetical protein